MTPEEFEDFIKYAYDAEYIAVDTEGTGLNVIDGRDYCMGIGVAYRVQGVGVLVSAYFPFRHNLKYDLPGVTNLDRSYLPRLKHLLETKIVICHNIKYDKPALQTLGITLNQFLCSMVISHMCNENFPSQSLDWLSKFLLKDEKYTTELFDDFIKRFGWPNLPISLADEYCQQDTRLALRILEYCLPILKKEEMLGLWPDQLKFINTLLQMEGHGVRIDTELCKELSGIAESRMAEIVSVLGFNPGTTNDITDFLFDTLKLPILAVGKPTRRWPEGRPSLDKAIMEEYDEMLNAMGANNSSARLVLEFRQHQKARTTWYEGFQNKLSPDGRLRSNYKVHGTKTGRLSSSEPNLQQLPRGGGSTSANRRVRQLLIPADGFQLWEYDYSQLELRVGVFYANEKELVKVFEDPDRDFFTELTLVAFPSVDPHSINPKTGNTYRHDIKTYFYARQYGAGIPKQSVLLQMEKDEVYAITARIDEAYPGFKRASNLCRDKAASTGFIRYWTGRRRHFGYWDDRYHKAFNSVMQGGAAEIVKHAMLRVSNLQSKDCHLLLQVHDSIITEELIGTHDLHSRRITEAMTDFPQFGIKLAVDCHEWGSK